MTYTTAVAMNLNKTKIIFKLKEKIKIPVKSSFWIFWQVTTKLPECAECTECTPWQIYFNLKSTKIMAKLVLPLLEVAILMINFPSIDLEIAWKTLQIDNFRKHWMKKMSSLIHEYKNKKIYTSTSEIWN